MITNTLLVVACPEHTQEQTHVEKPTKIWQHCRRCRPLDNFLTFGTGRKTAARHAEQGLINATRRRPFGRACFHNRVVPFFLFRCTNVAVVRPRKFIDEN